MNFVMYYHILTIQLRLGKLHFFSVKNTSSNYANGSIVLLPLFHLHSKMKNDFVFTL